MIWEWFWWGLGLILVLSEMIVPGLVVIFVGLGAFSVALLKHYGLIDHFILELLAWFVSSSVYCFTLRLVVIKYYPRDSVVQNVDEDDDVLGQEVLVSEDISFEKPGRIIHSDSTWPAQSKEERTFLKGEKVLIVGRDNLTWIVSKLPGIK